MGYYLKGNHAMAMKFHLALREMALRLKVDESFKQSVDQMSRTVKQPLLHVVASVMYHGAEYSNHFGHAYVDQPANLKANVYLQPYADIYYATILADASAKILLEQYHITQEEFTLCNQVVYQPSGREVIVEEIVWDAIEEVDVYSLYFTQ